MSVRSSADDIWVTEIYNLPHEIVRGYRPAGRNLLVSEVPCGHPTRQGMSPRSGSGRPGFEFRQPRLVRGISRWWAPAAHGACRRTEPTSR
jgi:hypothetical protein